MPPPSRNPTIDESAHARGFLAGVAADLGYPHVAATGEPAIGWATAVADRLGVARTSVSKVWSGARVMPAGWRERALRP